MRLGMWTVDFNLGEDLLVDLSPRLDLPPLASSDLDDVLLEVLQSTFLEVVLEDLVVLNLRLLSKRACTLTYLKAKV